MSFKIIFYVFCVLVEMVFIIAGISFANIYAISIAIGSPLPGQEVPVGELTIFDRAARGPGRGIRPVRSTAPACRR